ncbi:hypothetical protein PFICI_11056 [Pestalotiopsis fici W106-1]|uniref:Metallo-beta-lactamase domain-containing protein n=1 Tax=Pestalotiopsis fici (strain W106-1 / CGMCC3.15140) TaxID=1229662 RepID=W3WVM4_PESFW|nr:uncharacterized protein PFICI_11056 [Pestalotiopsis fici W106-1]ETS77182.1 hypothetical protein PFICI_11056 [Pestalotiopsis fici W106-1]
MVGLRFAVFVAPPVPFLSPLTKSKGGLWSPISCTLIYTEQEAVLVDTPITESQTSALIEWIQEVAPGRKLSFIYITHGHGDHFFGLPQLLEKFPEAKPVATAATLRHMEEQVEEQGFNATWEARFPGQIRRPFVLAQALGQENNFRLEGQWLFQAIECGHSDTYDSTVLWVPDLRLAVCGDVVYGEVHQMLFEANTKKKRQDWIRAIEQVEALNPHYVVAGHKKAVEADGPWHLASSKQYIADFGEILARGAEDADKVFEEMSRLYPRRFNPAALRLGCIGAFNVPIEQRI